jgi:sugar phosphate isomerase/epimerase
MTRESISRRRFLAGAAAAGVMGAVTRAASEEATDKKSVASRWRVGCYTRPWDQFDYRVALDAIAEAGYEYVGLMTTTTTPTHLVISVQTTPEEANAIAEECRKRRLNVLSAYGGDIPVAESVEAGVRGMKSLIDACAIVGVENLMMGGVGDPKLHDPYYQAIAECCPYAAEKKMNVSVKPHGGSNSTGPQCRAIIEKVARKNFGLWYDPGNIFYYSDSAIDPVDDSTTVNGLVSGVSIKDFMPPKEVLLTPGTGKVNFAKVFENLKKGGFVSGPLIVECLKVGELPQILEEAKKARAFVMELTKNG